MYQTYQRRRGEGGSYFLPFVSLIIIGVIVVLVFQIISYFQEKRERLLANKAAIEVVSGRAEIKIWGVDQWTQAPDGSILSEGDQIRTGPGSRVSITMLNGSTVRLNSETQVTLDSLKTRDNQDEAAFILESGNIWLKRTADSTVQVAFSVITPHLEINSTGTVFAVEKSAIEAVRVIEGKVKVNVKVEESDGEGMRVADSLDLALGQEVSVSEPELNDLRNMKPRQLLALFSDNFQESEWFSWNRAEDASGDSGITVEDAVKQNEESETTNTALIQTVEAPPQEVAIALAAPVIISPPEEKRTITSSSIIITGNVSSATERIEAITYFGGSQDKYILQKYAPGSLDFTYVASAQYGNLAPGQNRYTFVAIDKDQKRSDPADIYIMYDKPLEPADLSAPKAVSFNGSADNETDSDSVLVEGSVGKGAIKIYVNDFALTRYVPGALIWSYYAKTAYGNLKDGENSYSVYGVDASGNKTGTGTFTIIKKPAPVPALPSSPVL